MTLDLPDSTRLADALEALQSSLADAPIAVGMFEGADHVVRWANARLREVLGADPAPGRPLRGSGAAAGWIAMLDRVYVTGERVVTESLRLEPFRDAAGEIAGVCVAGVETRDRAAAEAEGRRFRRFVDGLDAVVWEGSEGEEPGLIRIDYVSEHAERMFGHPLRRWTSEPGFWLDLVHPDDRDAVLARIASEASAGRDHELEYRACTAGGSVLWVREIVHVGPSTEGSGRRYSGVMVDVTARKEAEQLAEAIIDAAPEGFALFDTDLRYVRVNDALARINGVPAADHAGRTIAEIVPDVPADGHLEPLRQVLETGRPVPDLEVQGVTAADPDSPHTWLVSYFPVRDTAGELRNIGALVTDITERKRSEERARLLAELGAILDEVVSLDERLDRFVHALVPELGSSCTITLRHGGRLERAAVAHVDPAGEAALAALPPIDDRRIGDIGRRTPRGTVVLDEITPAINRRLAGDEDAAAVRMRYLSGSGLLAPMHAGGRRIGHLVVTRGDVHRWGDHEIAFVEELARRAAITVETARLYESERTAREQIGRLQAVTAALSEALTPADVAAAVLAEGTASVGASMAAVWQVDGDGGALELIGHRGWTERAQRVPMARIDLSAALPVPDAVRTRRPVWLPDAEAKAEAYPALAQRAVGTSPDALYVLPLTAGTEPVGAIALCFERPERLDAETTAYAAALAAQCAQALERARLFEAEREVAGVLQRSLLPARMPQVPGAEFAVRYLPAAGLEAGGDFYEAIRLPSGAIGLAVGDVVGRGASAAAAMGQLRAALRAFAMEGDAPAGVLARLSAFAQTVDGAMAATAAYGVLDPGSGVLRYACAGHPYPVLTGPDGSAAYLREGRSLPLGVVPDPVYDEAGVRLEPGATLLLYTDGLVERRGEAFDDALENLRVTLAELSGRPLGALLDEVIARQTADSPLDDVALLAVRLSGERGVVRRLTIAAEPAAVAGARAEVRAWLTELGMPPAALTDVLLASGEAVANAVEHAYAGRAPGTVEIELRRSGRSVDLAVRDRGVWREAGGDPDRGRGFTLMRALMDDVEVERGAGGTTVRMRATLPEAPVGRPDPVPARVPAQAPPGEVTVDPGGAVVVRLTGALDLASAPAASEQLAALAGSGLLVVDLGDVEHVDSTGLRALLSAARLAGGRLTVVAPPGTPARRVLDLADAGSMLDLRDVR